MEDDVGIWVTFDVPSGHYLHKMFVPVDREALPAHIPVQRIIGCVLSDDAKPDINQRQDAMREAYRDACARNKTESDRAITKMELTPAAQPQPQEDPKDVQLASLREELAEVKAALKDSMHKSTAGGDAHATEKAREKIRPIRHGCDVSSRHGFAVA